MNRGVVNRGTVNRGIVYQSNFEDFFTDATLRIDYQHHCNAESNTIELKEIYRQDTWSRSTYNLIDENVYGSLLLSLYSKSDDTLIYSQSFNALSLEYQTTKPALSRIIKSFNESFVIPCPKDSVYLKLEKRSSRNIFSLIFEGEITLEVIRDAQKVPPPAQPNSSKHYHTSGAKIFDQHAKNPPESSLDLVILGDGYSGQELQKFEEDYSRFATLLGTSKPYCDYPQAINVWGIVSPSLETGISEPRLGKFIDSALGSSFNALNLKRYVLTENTQAVLDQAQLVPFDAVSIMFNHTRYGGGGIFRQMAVFPSDNVYSNYIFLHELGHSLAGLADEYYGKPVPYETPLGGQVEPHEPNVTLLRDPTALKWRHLVDTTTSLPTHWPKKEYERLSLEWQEKRTELELQIEDAENTGGSNEAEMNELNAAARAASKAGDEALHQLLSSHEDLLQVVGAFEGAYYKSAGYYRPMLNCIMFSKVFDPERPYCRVCEATLRQVVEAFQ